MQHFCQHWGITHRVSSAYHAQSNKRSEVGVKSAKRLVRDNIHADGSLDTDGFARAMLTHRNNPCPTTGLSPAQILFGRVLRDFLPIQPGKFTPRPEWRIAADQRASALARRQVLKHEQLNQRAKHLPPLLPGDTVAIQDQTGKTPRAWTKTGTILEALPHNSYTVKVDGSNHVTKRNRQFLRKILPFVPTPPRLINTPMLPAKQTEHTLPSDTMATPTNKVVPEPMLPTEPDAPVPLPTATKPNPIVPCPPNPGPAPSNKTQKSNKPPHLRVKWIVNPALKRGHSVDLDSLQPDQIQLGGGRGHH